MRADDLVDIVKIVGHEKARIIMLKYSNETLPSFSLYQKFERDAEIVSLWDRGVPLQAIAERKNVSVSTVRRVIQKFRN